MWLDFDNGQRRTHERIAALIRARKLPEATPLYYASMPDPTLDAGDTESIRALAARLLDRNIGLVMIDNLGVIAGQADENSAEMQRPMAGLRWLAETGVAVGVLHHQRKSSGVTATARKGEGLRGHGSIEAKLDLAIQIDRLENSNTITMTATKARGPSVKPFDAAFVYEHDEHNELLTARFWPDDTKVQDEKSTRANVIEELKTAGPMSATELHKRLGGNKQEFLDLLRTMNLERAIAKKQGPRGAFVLSLP